MYAELNILLRHRRLFIWVPIVSTIVALLMALAWGRDYIAESRFVPNSSDQLARVSGIAAQFGLMLNGSGAPSESPEFYTELLGSRELLTAAVLTEYRFAKRPGGKDSVSASLVDLYEVTRSTPEATVLASVEKLRTNLSISTGLRRAGIVSVATTAPWRDLSIQINRRLLGLVNDFNLRQRQSQAAAERRFVEGRLAQARDSLEQAENRLAGFLEQNRQYQASPRLLFESQRLQRRVDLAQGVYVTLARAVEEARIEEIRNTPVITVLDGPEGSARRAHSLRLIAAVGLVLGIIAAVIIAFLLEYSARDRSQNPEAYDEFERLSASMARSINLRRSRSHREG